MHKTLSPWRPMSEAPKDGTPILIKIRDGLTIEIDGDVENSWWPGKRVVVVHRPTDEDDQWAQDTLDYRTFFSEDEVEGWAPLPGEDGDLRARVAELERALVAEKGCHLLACKLVMERDARLAEMEERIAELEAAGIAMILKGCAPRGDEKNG